MAAETVSTAASDAAEGLHGAAEAASAAAEEKVNRTRKGAARLARGAADRLSSAGEYLEEHDANAMWGDVKTLIRNNPAPALIGAAAIGFLVARSFSGRD